MLFCGFSLHPFVGRALLLSGRSLLLDASVVRLFKHALLLNAFSALLEKVVCNSVTVKS